MGGGGGGGGGEEEGEEEGGDCTCCPTPTLSMSSAKPSGKGVAFMNSRLCLLGDLERHMTDEVSLTVSR